MALAFQAISFGLITVPSMFDKNVDFQNPPPRHAL